MDQTSSIYLNPDGMTVASDIPLQFGTVTPLVDRLSVNLLEPLYFDEIDSLHFQKRHVCGQCGTSLNRDFKRGAGRKFFFRCPIHGEIHEGEYVTRRQWSRAEQGMRAGMMEFWR